MSDCIILARGFLLPSAQKFFHGEPFRGFFTVESSPVIFERGATKIAYTLMRGSPWWITQKCRTSREVGDVALMGTRWWLRIHGAQMEGSKLSPVSVGYAPTNVCLSALTEFLVALHFARTSIAMNYSSSVVTVLEYIPAVSQTLFENTIDEETVAAWSPHDA